MKVGFISLGCAKNLYDSEMMMGLLKENDITITPNIDDSDIIIINTCGFIEASKTEAIDTIFEMLKYQQKGKKIVVTGCLSQRYLAQLKAEIPEVDLYITIDQYPEFAKHLSSILDKPLVTGRLSPTHRLLATPKHWSYLRIGDGCDNRCTYCAIPLIRKGNRSRPLEDIIEEAHLLKQKGVQELVLISQDTTRYGRDLNNDISLLPQLLKRLASEVNFPLIRFLYTYPDEISDELLDVVAQYDNIASYFDVPIQHASSPILQAMNRRGDNQFLKDLMKKIRNKVPNVTLRTTLIVGFPNETEDDFNCLLDFIKEVEFDRLGAFAYSPEEDTPSATFPNQIDEQTKRERLQKVMNVQENISLNRHKKMIGQHLQVIVDSYNPIKKVYLCRSEGFAPDGADGVVYVESSTPLDSGTFVMVEVTNASIHDLYAKIR